jgi:TPR repeat protein
MPANAQFRKTKEMEIRKERVEIDVSRAPLPAENEKVFVNFYNSFIETHYINDEGEFQVGQGIEDSPGSRALFLHYIAKNVPELTLEVGRRCPTCLGNSKVWVMVKPDDPLSLAKVEVDCEDCPSTGLIPTEVTYKFIYSSRRLPDLPEKPKVTKLRNLIVKALAGEVPSQLEYAGMLETGAPGVPKDVKLARELYAKSFASGSSTGLDGLVRLDQSAPLNVKDSERARHVLRLVQAKLNGSQEVRAAFEANTETLGITPPPSLGYIEVKLAEIEARTVYSYFKSGDLKLSHITSGGMVELLRPLKAQLDKNEPVTARAKIEYALIGYALDRMKLLKQAAVSMDPVAYAILGDISQRGLAGVTNIQAAAVLFSISKKIGKSSLVGDQLKGLDSRYESGKCQEMLEEFERTKSKGMANPYFIEAVLKLDVVK